LTHLLPRAVDEAGNVIISQDFVRNKYTLSPLPKKETKFKASIKGHPIWEGKWVHDNKEGGIIFIDKKKMEDQKGVLKFILKRIGKNLITGKSILNISLPVDIFSPTSNLEQLASTLAYAPTHLEPAAKNKSPVERLKRVVAFGISISPLYLNIEKPFNPILGETFQGWIDGCPVYGEQICHHPPIAALLYEGRGFRITAQLESKMELHMNSGCGTNDGVFQVHFEDGVEVCFVTPGGELKGLVYGERKFNIVGKCNCFLIQPTSGSPLRTCSWRFPSTLPRRASSRWASKSSLLTTSRAPSSESNLSSWRASTRSGGPPTMGR
jgi:hypothetical protein